MALKPIGNQFGGGGGNRSHFPGSGVRRRAAAAAGCRYAPNEAWKTGRSHFDVDIEGAPYRQIRMARCRVWCLEELRRYFEELVDSDQREVRARLEAAEEVPRHYRKAAQTRAEFSHTTG